MKVSEPVGDASWAAFFVRVTLGGFLVYKGLSELHVDPTLMQASGIYKVLPPLASRLLVTLLPFLEISGGAFLVIGFGTTLAALISALVIFTFVYGVGIFPPNTQILNKDLILLGAALSLMFSGAGALSVDRLKKGG